jgi:4-carboxymuconolactone decarboxylase
VGPPSECGGERARPGVEGGAERLGGRLRLLSTGELDPEQARLRADLAGTRGADAAAAGFELQLPDGRLIGPFNAYLHAPAIGTALRQWAAAIARHGLPADAQQAAILTVGVAWRSDYEIYAHAAEARHAGIPDGAIEAIIDGREPPGLSVPAEVAHRLALALAVDHEVSAELYATAVDAFGTDDLIALVNLIGRYMNAAAILACFAVPAPEGGRRLRG